MAVMLSTCIFKVSKIAAKKVPIAVDPFLMYIVFAQLCVNLDLVMQILFKAELT